MKDPLVALWISSRLAFLQHRLAGLSSATISDIYRNVLHINIEGAGVTLFLYISVHPQLRFRVCTPI